ncbi:amino acid ABC transporter permease [Rhizobium lusitanum]|uniref:amino acid ABC transporter permease n=1 Tax=Rhizobium lusitanum TaxID=293958 RepID=UPI002572EF78|nr:amino acid ABC transporter permease [Rhizobium lusitanum]
MTLDKNMWLVCRAGASGPNRKQLREQRLLQRSLAIAISSTIGVVGLLVLLVRMAPGWPKVQAAFFNVDILLSTFPNLLAAFLIDIAIFMWCAPIIAVLGLVIALCRDARSPALYPLRLFGVAYSDVFRGVPVILVIYLIGFGVPGLGLLRPWNSPYIWGSVALVLSYSAFVAEVYRTGIESIHESQRSAAKSLGLSHADIMRFVILPQAIRRVIPANMNNFVSLQKDVALLSFIGPVELLRQAGVEKSLLANFTPYVGASIIFLAVTVPATRYADRLIARQNRERS